MGKPSEGFNVWIRTALVRSRKGLGFKDRAGTEVGRGSRDPPSVGSSARGRMARNVCVWRLAAAGEFGSFIQGARVELELSDISKRGRQEITTEGSGLWKRELASELNTFESRSTLRALPYAIQGLGCGLGRWNSREGVGYLLFGDYTCIASLSPGLGTDRREFFPGWVEGRFRSSGCGPRFSVRRQHAGRVTGIDSRIQQKGD